MLVLTRKYQEKIRIGDNITITVLRAKGKAVRLGIEAPTDVPVIRGELSFESAEDDDQTTPSRVNVQSTVPARSPNRRKAAAENWVADSPHETNGRSRESQRSDVQLKRMPRGDVADYLPSLISSNAPLRAMMERR
jgi:carbon storage regulator CsrA